MVLADMVSVKFGALHLQGRRFRTPLLPQRRDLQKVRRSWLPVYIALSGCLAVKFDFCNNLLSYTTLYVHTLLVNILLACQIVYFKRKSYYGRRELQAIHIIIQPICVKIMALLANQILFVVTSEFLQHSKKTQLPDQSFHACFVKYK